MERGARRTGIIAILIVAIFILSVFAGCVVLTGASPAASAADTSPVAGAAETAQELAESPSSRSLASLAETLSSSGGSGAGLETYVSGLLGPYSADVSDLNATQWSALTELALGNSRPMFSAFNTGELNAYLIGAIIALSIALICGATLGIGCAVAIAALAITAIVIDYLCPISQFFGSDYGCSTPASEVASVQTAQLILYQSGEAANIEGVATTNLLDALNLTVAAMGYEAANAALAQLGNGTFNGALDAAQSGIAQQLGSVEWGDSTTLAYIEAGVLHYFGYYEGAGNPSSYFCPVTAGDGWGTVPYDTGGSNTCASTFNEDSNLELAYGAILGSPWAPDEELGSGGWVGTEYETNTTYPYFIQDGSGYSIYVAGGGSCPTDGELELELTPVSAAPSIFVNSTCSYEGGAMISYNNTWDLPEGGQNGMAYYIDTLPTQYQTTEYPRVQLNFLFPYADPSDIGSPASDAALSEFTGPNIMLLTPTTTPAGNALSASQSSPMTDLAVNPADELVASEGYLCGELNLYGGNANSTGYTHCPYWDEGPSFATNGEGEPNDEGAQANLGYYLSELLYTAVAEGQTYWSFLRINLGYTNADQVPASCYIPSPAQLLPPNVPLSDYLSMNVSNYLSLYMAQLEALGKTFNITEYTLSASTICGKQPTWNPDNATIGLGIYGVGYIYDPQETGTSNGTGKQVFGDPETWNISGEFFLAPSVADLGSLKTNTTYDLPTSNPTAAFVMPYYESNTSVGSSGASVNRLGPTTCPFGATSGCGLNAATMSYYPALSGNSTADAGLQAAKYPTDAEETAGFAVYLTGCMVADAGSSVLDPTYHYSTTCNFTEERFNASTVYCNGGAGTFNYGSNGQLIIVCGGSGGGGAGGITSTSGCGLGIPYLGTVIDDVAGAIGGALSSLPFGLGSGIGCLVSWLFTAILVVIVIWLVAKVVEGAASSSSRRQGD